jgi:hypothetical protein
MGGNVHVNRAVLVVHVCFENSVQHTGIGELSRLWNVALTDAVDMIAAWTCSAEPTTPCVVPHAH